MRKRILSVMSALIITLAGAVAVAGPALAGGTYAICLHADLGTCQHSPGVNNQVNTTIGLDFAKLTFHYMGDNSAGNPIYALSNSSGYCWEYAFTSNTAGYVYQSADACEPQSQGFGQQWFVQEKQGNNEFQYRAYNCPNGNCLYMGTLGTGGGRDVWLDFRGTGFYYNWSDEPCGIGC